MAEKAKITGYRSELVALGTIKGNAAVIRIPVNQPKPIPGNEISVREYSVVPARVFVDGKPTDKIADEKVWIYDPELK